MYERLRVQPAGPDADIRILTQISADALEQLGYQVRTMHDTGYILADRPVSRFIARYEMAVRIEPSSGERHHLKVTCKSRGCFDCEERQEVDAFLSTFDKLAQARELDGTVVKRSAAQAGTPRPSVQPRAAIDRPVQPSPPFDPIPAAPETIAFHRIYVTPSAVATGLPFTLTMEYTITDATIGERQVPVKVSYRISDGERVFLSTPAEVTCTNGQRTTKVLTLTAAKKEGAYVIEGLLSYNNELAKQATQLTVKRP